MKIKWRQVFFLVAIGVLALLIVRSLNRFGEFVHLLGRINLFILAPIILIRYLSYWSNAKYFESYLAAFQKKVPWQQLFTGVVAMNFVNTVFPSGSVSGTTYLGRELSDQVEPNTTTVAQIFYYAMLGVGLLTYMVIGFFALFLSNQIGRSSFRAVSIILFVVILIGVVALNVIFNRRMTEALLYWGTRPINFVLRRFQLNALSRKNVVQFLNVFYETLDYAIKHRSRFYRPFWYVWQGILWEVASVYIVLLAFGLLVNPGVVITAYVFALILSLTSIFTAGVGVYEATMVATFVALGLPFITAVPVVITYRVIAMWLFLPVGLYFYRQSIMSTSNGK